MKTLKSLKDGERFNLRNVGAIYSLQKLDHKKKTAIYTSEWSGRTFTSNWNRKYFLIVK